MPKEIVTRTVPLRVTMMHMAAALVIQIWFQKHPNNPKIQIVDGEPKLDDTRAKIWQIGVWPAGVAELTLDEAARSKGISSDELLTHIAMGRLKPAYRTWQGMGYSIPGNFTLDAPKITIPSTK